MRKNWGENRRRENVRDVVVESYSEVAKLVESHALGPTLEFTSSISYTSSYTRVVDLNHTYVLALPYRSSNIYPRPTSKSPTVASISCLPFPTPSSLLPTYVVPTYQSNYWFCRQSSGVHLILLTHTIVSYTYEYTYCTCIPSLETT